MDQILDFIAPVLAIIKILLMVALLFAFIACVLWVFTAGYDIFTDILTEIGYWWLGGVR